MRTDEDVREWMDDATEFLVGFVCRKWLVGQTESEVYERALALIERKKGAPFDPADALGELGEE